MKEFELKYGCNPNQKPAKIFMNDSSELPIEILCGRPGYINFLDAFNSWQLVKELKEALGLPAVTSFKHVSPTSAAVGIPLSDKLKKACFVDDIEGLDDSPLACAYARTTTTACPRSRRRMTSCRPWRPRARPAWWATCSRTPSPRTAPSPAAFASPTRTAI